MTFKIARYCSVTKIKHSFCPVYYYSADMCNINTPHTARCANVLQFTPLIYFLLIRVFFLSCKALFHFYCDFNSVTPQGAVKFHLFPFHLLYTVYFHSYKVAAKATSNLNICVGENCVTFPPLSSPVLFCFFYVAGEKKMIVVLRYMMGAGRS